MNEKDMLLKMREQELQITLKVLRAFPADKLDFKPPHETFRTAGELAFVFAIEEMVGQMALAGKIDFSGPLPKTPTTMEEIIAAIESSYSQVTKSFKAASEENLQKQIDFGGNTMRVLDVFWIMLHDQIHHRGQFSVYIRLSGGKVPSIYGPSADDPGGIIE